jgi:hypothetical protein
MAVPVAEKHRLWIRGYLGQLLVSLLHHVTFTLGKYQLSICFDSNNQSHFLFAKELLPDC